MCVTASVSYLVDSRTYRPSVRGHSLVRVFSQDTTNTNFIPAFTLRHWFTFIHIIHSTLLVEVQRYASKKASNQLLFYSIRGADQYMSTNKPVCMFFIKTRSILSTEEALTVVRNYMRNLHQETRTLLPETPKKTLTFSHLTL